MKQHIDVKYYEHVWYTNGGDGEGDLINLFTDERYLMLMIKMR